MYLCLHLAPRVERSVLGAVAHVAAIIGEAAFFAQLLKLIAVILREAPLLGDVDLENNQHIGVNSV